MIRTFRLLFILIAVVFSNVINAQDVCFSENFNNENAYGWTLSSGAEVEEYDNPVNCQEDNGGIITPGVGGNNPARIRTPFITANGSSIVKVKFDIYRMNANLNCNSWSDFSCPTAIDVTIYKGSTSFTALADLVLPHNGPTNSPTVNLTINVQNQLPAGTSYKVEINFKKKTGSTTCVQTNTKYIIDNFSVCQPQNNVIVLNAVDDNLCPLAATTNTFSNDLSSNDIRPAGANLIYTLVNGPYGNSNISTGGANLTINSDGTFTMVRTEPTLTMFDFTYRVTDAVTGSSDLATCVVCFNEAGPVPLQLVSVNAVRKNNLVTVSWKTALESNLTAFEVQRKINGQFTTVGTVAPQNSSNGASYNFNEVNTTKTISEYRIRSVEAGNVSKFSAIRTVAGIDGNNTMLVYPNPSPGIATVSVTQVSGSLTVEVLDNTGRVIKRVQSSNDNSVTFTGLKTGIYLVRATDLSTGESTVQKLVVEQ